MTHRHRICPSRFVLATWMGCLFASTVGAQGFKTVYGSNPLERIQGPDYTTTEFPGRWGVAPSYSAQYGLTNVRGGSRTGSDQNSRPWDPRMNGTTGRDPFNGIAVSTVSRNPFLRQWWNLPGGTLNSGLRFPSVGNAFPGLTPTTPVSVPGLSFFDASTQAQLTGARSPLASDSTFGEETLPNGVASTSEESASHTGSNGSGVSLPQPTVSGNGDVYTSRGLLNSDAASALRTFDSYGNPMPGLTTRNMSLGLGTPTLYPGAYGATGPAPQKQPSWIPPVLGGLVGVVLGGSLGGTIGVLAGGVGGYLVGKFIADQSAEAPYQGFLDNLDAGYYGGYPYPSAPTNSSGPAGPTLNGTFGSISNPGAQPSAIWGGTAYDQDYYDMYYGRGKKPLTWLPGILGAVLGATLGAKSGPLGLIVGGALGLLAGSVSAKVLFPQATYDAKGIGYVYPTQDPYNSLGPFRSGLLPYEDDAAPSLIDPKRGGSDGTGLLDPVNPPTLPQLETLTPLVEITTPGDLAPEPVSGASNDLQTLRDAFQASLESFRKSLESGTAEERVAAQATYEAARKAYLEAKVDGRLKSSP